MFGVGDIGDHQAHVDVIHQDEENRQTAEEVHAIDTIGRARSERGGGGSHGSLCGRSAARPAREGAMQDCDSGNFGKKSTKRKSGAKTVASGAKLAR
jgi:hypothetical protein